MLNAVNANDRLSLRTLPVTFQNFASPILTTEFFYLKQKMFIHVFSWNAYYVDKFTYSFLNIIIFLSAQAHIA